MKVTIPLRILRGLSIVACQDDIRYMLHSVCLERRGDGGGFAVATDGRRLMVMKLDESCFEGEGQIIVPMGVIRRVPWSDKASKKATVVQIDENSMMNIHNDNMQIRFKPLVGSYPNWKQVLPTSRATRSVACISINYVLLMGMQKAASIAMGLGMVSSATVLKLDNHDGYCVGFSQDEDIYGICMPVRLNVPAEIPQWVVDKANKGKEASDAAQKA